MRAMKLAMALDLFAMAPDAEAVIDPKQVEASSPERWLRPAERRAELDRWRDAVGPASVWAPPGAPTSGAAIDAFHVVVWNSHVGAGAIERLVADLRRGALTQGVPVEHFALLLQEVYRGGDAVPATLPPGSRSARSIRPAAGPDGRIGIDEVARRTALHLFYVPSMRNGRNATNPEDRGNAILATFPLTSPTAIDLPFERERRVAITADIAGTTAAGTWRIRLVNLHLDARSSWRDLPRSFGAGRARQMHWLLEALRDDDAYTVLGGDFNSWTGGANEAALRMPEKWGFVRGTPPGGSTWNLRWFLGVLDHVFYRLPSRATTQTREIEDAYGSDHRPLLGWVRLDPD
jgi:endonuclease/exonuclease/phosphatase family metal-dependent hydrolase